MLLAHNGKNFDFPVLMFHILKEGLYDEFSSVCATACDSLLIFRGREKQESKGESRRKETAKKKKSFSQESLVKEHLGKDYNAHNAISDVILLEQLWQKEIDKSLIVPYLGPPVGYCLECNSTLIRYGRTASANYMTT